jgi:uncharacterized protein (DUF433 family)
MSNKFPPGWDEEPIRRVLAHYEHETEEEAVAEDEAAFEQKRRDGEMLGFDRITFDPRIMSGQACIRGMRIPVSLVVNLVAHGKQTTEILEEYPDLESEDIRQTLEWHYGRLSASKRIQTEVENYG